MIHPTAIIYPGVKIGNNVEIGAYCIIGAKAESLKHWNEPERFSVVIGDNVKITGHVTIDAGTDHNTYIKDNAFIMKGCHIGHDALICDDVIMSPHSIVGGHATIGHRTNMGMGSIIHQRCIVPSDCMIGMNTTVTKKSQIEANGVYVGSPAKFIRWNNQRK
jgi:UDP-N-acetylglucosamine acyltransferase